MRDLDDPAIARDMEHRLVKHGPMALAGGDVHSDQPGRLVPTPSTTYNEPYNLARTLATLDILSEGRAGWNMVTSFGVDEAWRLHLRDTLDSTAGVRMRPSLPR